MIRKVKREKNQKSKEKGRQVRELTIDKNKK